METHLVPGARFVDDGTMVSVPGVFVGLSDRVSHPVAPAPYATDCVSPLTEPVDAVTVTAWLDGTDPFCVALKVTLLGFTCSTGFDATV